MSPQQEQGYHLNQLVPDMIAYGFPELKGVEIISEFGDTGHFFTEHEYHRIITIRTGFSRKRGRYNSSYYKLRFCDELRGAPIPVIWGAGAIELQQIAKKEGSRWRYRLQRAREKCSVPYQIMVSHREDADLINRGLGGSVAEFNKFISDNCGYVWNPLDGFPPDHFEKVLDSYYECEGKKRITVSRFKFLYFLL